MDKPEVVAKIIFGTWGTIIIGFTGYLALIDPNMRQVWGDSVKLVIAAAAGASVPGGAAKIQELLDASKRNNKPKP